MSQHGERTEPMHVVESGAYQRAIDFRFTELDRKFSGVFRIVLKSYAPSVNFQKYSAWTANLDRTVARCRC